VTGGVLKIARRIWKDGVAGTPVIGRRRGAFSTLLRRPGLRTSSDGVLAIKSERKMLASTCLYSLYAWFVTVVLTQSLQNTSWLHCTQFQEARNKLHDIADGISDLTAGKNWLY